MTLIHVLWSDPLEFVADAKPARLWCFNCRKRLMHRLKVVSGKYYDPEFFWACDRCGGSHTEFPHS